MSETLNIRAGSTVASHAAFTFLGTATQNAAPSVLAAHMPPSIPADQAYYWSTNWQRDVRESIAALESGDFVEFADPQDTNDIVRWFLSDDE